MKIVFDGKTLRVTERVQGYDLEPVYRIGVRVGAVAVPAEVEVETVVTDPARIRQFFRSVR